DRLEPAERRDEAARGDRDDLSPAQLADRLLRSELRLARRRDRPLANVCRGRRRHRGADARPAPGLLQAAGMVLTRLLQLARSPTGRVVVAAGSGAFLLAVAALAARRFTATSWPLARGNPALLAAVGCLSLVGYAFKAYGWR